MNQPKIRKLRIVAIALPGVALAAQCYLTTTYSGGYGAGYSATAFSSEETALTSASYFRAGVPDTLKGYNLSYDCSGAVSLPQDFSQATSVAAFGKLKEWSATGYIKANSYIVGKGTALGEVRR
jgi:hypothetical protein